MPACTTIPVELIKSGDGDVGRKYKSHEEAAAVLRARMDLIAARHRLQKPNSLFLSSVVSQVIVSETSKNVTRREVEDDLLDSGLEEEGGRVAVALVQEATWWRLDMTREVTLDFSDERYVGNRGLVFAAEFVKCFLPKLKSFAFANCGLFSNMTSPTSMDGNKALELVLGFLSGHPALESLDVSRNPLGTRAYVIIAKFLKESPSVVELKMDGTLMSEGEIRHLGIILDGNKAAQKRTQKAKALGSFAIPSGGEDLQSPPNTDATSKPSLYFTDKRLKALLARDPQGGSSRPEDYASNIGEALPVVAKEGFRRYQADFAAGMSSKQGGSPFSFAIHPTERMYLKTEETRARLAKMVRDTPQFQALVWEAFPSSRGEVSQTTQALIALRQTLDVGLSLAEQEQINLEKKQTHQIEAILMFVVDSLQKADYRVGLDVLVEGGDTPLWVGLMDNGTSSMSSSDYLAVATKKGAEGQPAAALVCAKYPSSTFFGDMEILQSFASGAKGSRIASIVVEPVTAPNDRSFLNTSAMEGSFIAATPTTSSLEPTSHDNQSVITTWLLSRDLYVRIFAPFLAARRKRHGQLLEEVSGLYGVPHMSKICLSEIVEDFYFDPNERFERDCQADPSLKRKYLVEMRRMPYPVFNDSIFGSHILIVEDGRLCLKKGVSELAQFSRGAVINVLDDVDPSTGLSSRKGMVLETAPIAMPQVHLWKIKRSDLSKVPLELRAALEAKGSTFKITT